MTELSNVVNARQELVQSISAYVESQLDTWRKVPWLALRADGRHGGMGFYSTAYMSGMWELHTPEKGLHRTFVDCGAGTLWHLGDRTYRPLIDCKYMLLANYLEHLDATSLVESLKQDILNPLSSYISEEQAASREQERVRIQRERNLTEVYERPAAKAA